MSDALTLTESLMLRRLYEAERAAPNRNYAKDHSFEAWLDWLRGV